ncbi:MAG TPA: polysaccharide deacetylase family protein [Armatimonadota bacterium]|jgi:peptidoglycan/xylan/chitin deacetylase (PgdA/CDA1 family)
MNKPLLRNLTVGLAGLFLFGLLLHSSARDRAAAETQAAPLVPVRTAVAPAPAWDPDALQVGYSLPGPGSASMTADSTMPQYGAALGLLDGALLAGDDSNAAHWLAAGLLMSQGDLPAARSQLRRVIADSSDDSILGLKARLLLNGQVGQRKLIALAFDDFPFPKESLQLLNVLSQYHAPGTFFAIGHKVRDYPDLVALALTQGHSIQNHTYHHYRLTDLTAVQVADEFNLCSRTIRDFTGVTPRYLRCPHAAFNGSIEKIATQCHLVCVDPIVTNIYDMSASSDLIYRRCMQRARPGAIFALHDGLPATIKAMPRVITDLRAQGYEFVTVDQLLSSGATPPTAHPTRGAQTRAAGGLDLAALLGGQLAASAEPEAEPSTAPAPLQFSMSPRPAVAVGGGQ